MAKMIFCQEVGNPLPYVNLSSGGVNYLDWLLNPSTVGGPVSFDTRPADLANGGLWQTTVDRATFDTYVSAGISGVFVRKRPAATADTLNFNTGFNVHQVWTDSSDATNWEVEVLILPLVVGTVVETEDYQQIPFDNNTPKLESVTVHKGLLRYVLEADNGDGSYTIRRHYDNATAANQPWESGAGVAADYHLLAALTGGVNTFYASIHSSFRSDVIEYGATWAGYGYQNRRLKSSNVFRQRHGVAVMQYERFTADGLIERALSRWGGALGSTPFGSLGAAAANSFLPLESRLDRAREVMRAMASGKDVACVNHTGVVWGSYYLTGTLASEHFGAPAADATVMPLERTRFDRADGAIVDARVPTNLIDNGRPNTRSYAVWAPGIVGEFAQLVPDREWLTINVPGYATSYAPIFTSQGPTLITGPSTSSGPHPASREFTKKISDDLVYGSKATDMGDDTLSHPAVDPLYLGGGFDGADADFPTALEVDQSQADAEQAVKNSLAERGESYHIPERSNQIHHILEAGRRSFQQVL